MRTDAVWRRRRCTASSLLRDLWGEGYSWRAALMFLRISPYPLGESSAAVHHSHSGRALAVGARWVRARASLWAVSLWFGAYGEQFPAWAGIHLSSLRRPGEIAVRSTMRAAWGLMRPLAKLRRACCESLRIVSQSGSVMARAIANSSAAVALLQHALAAWVAWPVQALIATIT